MALLGLACPLGAQAQHLNLEDTLRYRSQSQQDALERETQASGNLAAFADIYPEDWSYQALVQLSEHHDCSAAAPATAMADNLPLTRYEAAALVADCLREGVEVGALADEFSAELAVLGTRVDELESQVAELKAAQFSTTSKLRGEALFAVGGVGADVDNDDASTDKTAIHTGSRMRLNLLTSFTGRDQMVTRIQMKDGLQFKSATGYNGYSLQHIDGNGETNLLIDKLYYRFPLSNKALLAFGYAMEDEYFLAFPKSYYASTAPMFSSFKKTQYLGGTGTGAGGTLKLSDNWYFSSGYIADKTDAGDPDENKGLTGEETKWYVPVQLNFRGNHYLISANYRYVENWAKGQNSYGTDLAKSLAGNSSFSDWTISGNLKLRDNISMTGSYGTTRFSVDSSQKDKYGDTANSSNWMLGLSFNDVFTDNDKAGFAYGQQTYVGNLDNSASESEDSQIPYAFEAWYIYQVTDNISIQPALTYISKTNEADLDSVWGGLLLTKIKF